MNDEQPHRIFVGIKIAPDIARELALLARPLERFPVRLIPAHDLHVTLVPPWDESNVPAAIETLSKSARGFQPTTLVFQRICYGPAPRRPRLLWAECAANPDILQLQKILLDAFAQSEERPYQPHVTLARIRKNGRAIARQQPMDQRLAFVQSVDTVELFRSPQRGSIGYQVLASIALQAQPGLPALAD